MKLNDVDLNKVAVFCQILESGNYRKASEVLNVSPSALSQTLSVLENSLGFPLFLRSGRKLVPTEKGLQLYRDFRIHHLALVRAVEKLTQKPTEVQGILRIGAYLEFAKTQLAPVLQQFLAQFPKTQVKLVFDSPSKLAKQVTERRLDFCFSIFPSQEKNKIRSSRILEEELVLISPPGWFKKNADFTQVTQSPMIEYYLNHQLIRRWLALHYRRRPKDLPIRAFVSNADMVLSMVTLGAGIGVVPGYLLTRENRNRVEVFNPTGRRLMDNLWLLEPQQASGSPVQLAFRTHVNRHFTPTPT